MGSENTIEVPTCDVRCIMTNEDKYKYNGGSIS
jgi:hypothetical protein